MPLAAPPLPRSFDADGALHDFASLEDDDLERTPFDSRVMAVRPIVTPVESTLRIGMTRELHERIRMVAALQEKPPTVLVRELLETLPVFDPTASLRMLSDLARGLAPRLSAAQPRIDTRMQVVLTEEAHFMLHKLAALRTQTLGACLTDLLEARLPEA
jgi:hypothetical protein